MDKQGVSSCFAQFEKTLEDFKKLECDAGKQAGLTF